MKASRLKSVILYFRSARPTRTRCRRQRLCGLTALLFGLAIHPVFAQAPAAPDPASDIKVVLSKGTVPQAIERKNPRYPREAQNAGMEGWVRVRFAVDERGRPKDIEVYRSSGVGRVHELFERETVRALKRWKFEPAVLDGEPTSYDNFFQTMLFSIAGENDKPRLTRTFHNHLTATINAIEAGDLDAARVSLDELEAQEIRFLSEHAFLATTQAMYWQATGDHDQALEAAEQALWLFDDQMTAGVEERVLRIAALLNAHENNYHEALERFDALLALTGPLESDDPLFQLDERIKAALAAEEPVVTEGAIERCALCRGETYLFGRDLNRNRFLVEVESGSVESVRVSCPPAHVSLAWGQDVVWNLAQDPADCSVSLRGEPGTQVRLVELR